MKRLLMCCLAAGIISMFIQCNNSGNSGSTTSDTTKRDMTDTTHRDTSIHSDTGSRH